MGDAIKRKNVIVENETVHNENFRVVSRAVHVDVERYQHSRDRWRKVSKSLKVSPAPLHVDIELTNECDIRCLMCERRFMKRPKGMMSMEMFCSIIDECEKIGVDSVKLNLWGEPTLHNELIDMVRYAKENSSLIVQFNTNANRMTPTISRGLIMAGLDKLTISIDGVKKETYAQIRRGGSFDKVIGNVKGLLDIKREMKSALPLVTLQIIRMTINENEVGHFVDYWKDEVDYVSVTNIGVIDGNEDILDLSLRENHRVGFVPCSQLWQRLSILWDGIVTVCCKDYEGVLLIGKIGQNCLLDLWHGERLTRLRKKHEMLDFDGLICRNCVSVVNYGD